MLIIFVIYAMYVVILLYNRTFDAPFDSVDEYDENLDWWYIHRYRNNVANSIQMDGHGGILQHVQYYRDGGTELVISCTHITEYPHGINWKKQFREIRNTASGQRISVAMEIPLDAAQMIIRYRLKFDYDILDIRRAAHKIDVR